MARNNAIRKLRTLYAILIVIMGGCIALFIFNVVSPAEPLYLSGISETTKDYGVIVTDLNSSDRLYMEQHEIEGLSEGLSGTANVSRFNVNLQSDDPERLFSNGTYWCIALRIFGSLCAIATTVLVVMVLVSLYVNVRKGRVFPKRHIKWLAWAGALMIAFALCIDASTCIEQSVAMHLLEGSSWQPQATYQIHITRIIFGITILFVAELFYIGRDMQEEQDLTI